MRFKPEKIGDKRERNGFLFLKTKIGEEMRWLEFAEWEEELMEIEITDHDCSVPYKKLKWIKTRWIPDFIPL